MSQSSNPGAPRADVPRPPRRESYPDLSRPFGDERPARITRDTSSGRRYEVRLVRARADRLDRYEVVGAGTSCVVTDRGDYAECGCREFGRDWDCVHVRLLVGLGLVKPVRFVLTCDTGKGGGHGGR